ncbi:sensor domain-containing diguanylate cyclase [Rhodoferax sp.]|uniref:sensor domain-containing diguanylate cyclase n=1 Tax=Rhodoferax sp. TaxID=50421 RepID=UPI0025F5A6D3|nr:sensor domain-containing diguanylate cyclase [Rhodoferax sp.]MCM2342612.1 diguanylate cyclase [Rhodoferax sp.]
MVYRKNPPGFEVLRQLATARLSGHPGELAAAALDLQQVRHLLEELEIHQIELELQNEHLNTARAQLEQALNQSSELYDFAPVGNVLINVDGNITKLNLAAAQLLASERAQLVGSRLAIYVAAAQRAQFNTILAHARDEQETQAAEFALQIDGLEPLPVQVKVVWIGPKVGWLIALVDVSESRHMEEQLRASEERLTLALKAVGDAVWDWQVNSGEVLISEGYAQLIGTSTAVLSMQCSDLMDYVLSDDREQLLLQMQDCIVGKRDSYRIEHRLQSSNGSVKWVLARGAVVLRSAVGTALRVVGTLVDISQRKQIEADLVTAAQFQRAIFDSISAQIAVLDQDGMVLYTNAAWRSYMSKLGFEESVGQNYLKVLSHFFAVDSPTVAVVAAGMAAITAGEAASFHAPEPICCVCGRWWFTVKVTSVQDPSHRMVVTHEDVSVLKRAELASQTLANVDNLTDAMSRQHFMSLADQELVRSRRYQLPLVVLMLDLDHFKNVNDNYGHPTGDVVLKRFVQTVKGVLRESDLIGRIGGEEFAVLLPNTTQEGGCALANRIIDAVRANPVVFEKQTVAYTVSIGASYLTQQSSFGEMLAESDAALYRAKKGGRDRLEVCWNDAAPRPDDSTRTLSD